MQEIEFRGKALMEECQLSNYGIKHKNGWVKGNLIQNGEYPWIVGNIAEVDCEYIYPEFWVSVDPETVSQYIGIKDIHKKKVFQGDIVKVKRFIFKDCRREEVEGMEEYIGEVVWHQFGWHIAEKIKDGIRYHSLWLWNIKDDESDLDTHFMEIIGNKWDNPEMAVIEW